MSSLISNSSPSFAIAPSDNLVAFSPNPVISKPRVLYVLVLMFCRINGSNYLPSHEIPNDPKLIDLQHGSPRIAFSLYRPY